MSAILEKIAGDLKDAMKSKDSFRLGVLRLIKTEAKNKEIDLMHALTEQDFIAVLSRMANQRKDSIEQYLKANREDLANNEKAELGLISEYLPKALSETELKDLIQAALKATNATGPKDMGAVMKELKEKTAGRVDGKVLAETVKKALGG